MEQTKSTRRRNATRFALASILTISVLIVPAATATAAPTLSISAYKITADLPASGVPNDGPSTLQAGANPNAGSYSAFGYTNSTEDLKTALTNFAPGLLGNPESVPKCSEAALQAGGSTCSASEIGTSRLDTRVALFGVAGPSFPGKVFNAEPLGNEPGRLGVVTPTPLGTLISSIPFTITPRGAKDYGLTGTLTDISRLTSPPPNDLQVRGLSFILNGTTNKYVRNPTSCMDQVSTGQAIGYDDPTVVEGPNYTFTTVGCDQVAFDPKVSIEIGDRGTTKLNGYPPLVVKITQAAGEADERGNKITLPVELNSNNTAYKLCTQAQADADACPADSKFGGVVARSPFLSEQLAGPVYLIQQSSNSLPGLLLDLRGRAHVKIQTTTALVNGKQIQSLALDTPQLPISELRVALNGGKNTGVFQNRTDLCFQGDSKYKFNSVNAVAKFYGWNGKNTADTKIATKVNGCGPGVSGNLSGATGNSPSLTVKVKKHTDAPNVKELTVSLSRNLSLVRDRLESGATASAIAGASFEYVSSHSFKVTGLPAAGVAKATLRLRKGAVRVSRRSVSLLKRGRSRTFKVKARQTPVTGSATSTLATFRERGR